AGFQTTVLPYASAGAIFQAGMAMGKFQGVIAATTPTGSRRGGREGTGGGGGGGLPAGAGGGAGGEGGGGGGPRGPAKRSGERLPSPGGKLAAPLVGPPI